MYNEYLRSKCMIFEEYDRMIVLIMQHNTSAVAVDIATNAINCCIRGCSEESKDYSTGMCMALWTVNGVRLFLHPSSADTVTSRFGSAIRDQFKDF